MSYYSTLELYPNATDEQIRLAYERLTHKYHPGRLRSGNPILYKKCIEAYEVLRDPIKKGMYDSSLLGNAEVEGGNILFENEHIRTFLEKHIEGAGAGGIADLEERLVVDATERKRGADVFHTVSISLEEAYRGAERYECVLPKDELCLSCIETCKICGGTGSVLVNRIIANIKQKVTLTCKECEGRTWVLGPLKKRILAGAGATKNVRLGRTHAMAQAAAVASASQGNEVGGVAGGMKEEVIICPTCQNKGSYRKEETYHLNLHPGVDSGFMIRLPGKGQQIPFGNGTNGDAYIRIAVVIQDPLMERVQEDLLVKLPLPFIKSITGAKFKIRLPSGDSFVFDTRSCGEVINPARLYKIEGRGMPKWNPETKEVVGYGRLYIQALIRYDRLREGISEEAYRAFEMMFVEHFLAGNETDLKPT